MLLYQESFGGIYMGKIIINYDLFDAILNVNGEMTPLKIIRNNKKVIAFWYLPVLTVLNLSASKNLLKTFEMLCMEFGMLIGSVLFYNLVIGIDDYKNQSIEDLKTLVYKLKEMYVNTDYELLTQSKLIRRNYQVKYSKENFLAILESKYFLVPTYDFNNNVKNTGILQEHLIGTNEYVLSLGSPKKELKLAHASI